MAEAAFGKNAHDLRPPFDSFVQAFERIRAVQLALMVEGQMAVRQDVFRGLREDGCRPGKPCPQPVGDLPQLRQGQGVIRLGEDRAHDRRDCLARAVRHRREQVAHEVGRGSVATSCRSAPC